MINKAHNCWLRLARTSEVPKKINLSGKVKGSKRKELALFFHFQFTATSGIGLCYMFSYCYNESNIHNRYINKNVLETEFNQYKK